MKPTNKMKPEDVMRALECCCVYCNCNGCPYYHGEPEEDCHYKMMKAALALLREKDALIAELTQTNAEKDAEICVKKKLLDKCEERFAEKDEEIERLTHICHCYALQYGTVMDQSKAVREIRDEAVTEFAENLKSHMIGSNKERIEVMQKFIDHWVEKMKGDQRE